MSRVIKATYVRLEAEPLSLENPELIIEPVVEEFDEELAGVEDERESQINNLYQRRLDRIREMEEALEIHRQEQLSEIEQNREESLANLAALRQQTESELETLRVQVLATARDEGTSQGREEGKQQAYDEAKAETQRMLEQAVQMLQQAASEARARVIEGERDIVEIALSVAAKVIESELIEREETTLALVRTALRGFKQVPQVIVKVPQTRYPLISESMTKLKEEFRQIISLDCVADPTLPLSDVVVDSPFGMMDVRFDAQLEILREALLAQLEEYRMHP